MPLDTEQTGTDFELAALRALADGRRRRSQADWLLRARRDAAAFKKVGVVQVSGKAPTPPSPPHQSLDGNAS
ncbi:MAG: hypothetical protein ACK4JB_22190 [Reyranella sp.]